MDIPAVDIQNVSFKYESGKDNIFNEINLSISQRDRFGLFGPNGAGKTTLMSLMTGLLYAASGKVKLLGIETEKKKVNELFGYVPQDLSFYQELTPVENFQFFGAWYGLGIKEIRLRSDELLNILGLKEVKNKQVQSFSGGMKRRVNLAIGVLHNPKILFLDEPTVGVDVQTRHAIIHYLKELNQQGTTLIYTSHLLSEAEELCDKIALMDHGQIIALGDIGELIKANKQTNLDDLFLQLTGKEYRN